MVTSLWISEKSFPFEAAGRHRDTFEAAPAGRVAPRHRLHCTRSEHPLWPPGERSWKYFFSGKTSVFFMGNPQTMEFYNMR